jgi:hypothetical protein
VPVKMHIEAIHLAVYDRKLFFPLQNLPDRGLHMTQSQHSPSAANEVETSAIWDSQQHHGSLFQRLSTLEVLFCKFI